MVADRPGHRVRNRLCLVALEQHAGNGGEQRRQHGQRGQADQQQSRRRARHRVRWLHCAAGHLVVCVHG
jgi:hypothetical protein